VAVRPLHDVGRTAISTADLYHDGITIGLGDVMTLDNDLVSHLGTHGSLLVAVTPTIEHRDSGGANRTPPPWQQGHADTLARTARTSMARGVGGRTRTGRSVRRHSLVTVLHLLPDNELVIDDGAIVGPGAMIQGCHIGAGSVIEPGAIVCDGSVVGDRSVVRAGAVVKQRSRFPHSTEIDGLPAVEVARIDPPALPAWALSLDDLPVPTLREPPE
jgi:hypothetical protein